MEEQCNVGAALGAAVLAAGGLGEAIAAPHAAYRVECVDAEGRVRWRDRFTNMVVTAGRNDLLSQYFKGNGYTAAWYVGLIDNAGFSAIAATDTMAAHPGWAESTAYANATRAVLALGTASAGSIDNAGNAASFSINAAASIRGAFVANTSAKGAASGTLYSAGTFAATRSVASGDTLNVTVAFAVS
jgi:hypothetical protein